MLNGLAICIELSLLFQDVRWTTGFGTLLTLFWYCCMDAMPKPIRKFASLVAIFGVTDFIVLLVCVHYSFFPFLYDYSLNIRGITWSLKQLFSTSCVNVTIYWIRYGVLTIMRPNSLFILTARITPVDARSI